MAYGLTGLTAGTLVNITEEDSMKDANLFTQQIPRKDSDQTITLDLFGASRNITLRGNFADGTASVSIATFISQLDGLITGVQTNKTYTSDTSGTTYNVKVQSVRWRFEEGSPKLLRYEISLMQAKSGL